MRLSEHRVWCWGNNAYGQLGNDSTTAAQSPTEVSLLTSVDVVGMDAGTNHTCAWTESGTALCWGRNEERQIIGTEGLDFRSPIEMPGLTDVVGMAAGNAHTCAWRSDGTAWCWGSNEHGQLGNGLRSSVSGHVEHDFMHSDGGG
jgi:alpha-tubulin suppressor-like RCC1 family protein